MAQFRKRPVVIEAFQWTGGPDQLEDPEWIVEAIRSGEVRVDPGVRGIGNRGKWPSLKIRTPALKIRTPEGTMTANAGDWVIRGTAGEIYPCKPEIFAAIYEKVEGDG